MNPPNKIPTTVTSNGLIAQVRIIDEASPQIAATIGSIGPASQAAVQAMGEAVKESVKKSYKRAQMEYQDHPLTMRYKMAVGASPRTLEEWGDLKDSLDTCEVKPDTEGAGAFKVTVAWEFPTAGESGLLGKYRKDKSFVYVLAHEFGSGRMKKRLFEEGGYFDIENVGWTLAKRPFLIRGIQEGMAKGEGAAATIMMPTLAMNNYGILRIKGQFMGAETLGVGILPSMVPHGMFGMGMYFVPPSKAYAVMGAGADLAGVLKGSFSEKASYGYLRQMLWGQLGMTKKTSRRKIRGTLWGTR